LALKKLLSLFLPFILVLFLISGCNTEEGFHVEPVEFPRDLGQAVNNLGDIIWIYKFDHFEGDNLQIVLEYYEHGELENFHRVLDIDSPRKGHIAVNKIGDTWQIGATYNKQETEEKGGIRKPVETYIPEFTGISVIEIHERIEIENDNNVIVNNPANLSLRSGDREPPFRKFRATFRFLSQPEVFHVKCIYALTKIVRTTEDLLS